MQSLHALQHDLYLRLKASLQLLRQRRLHRRAFCLVASPQSPPVFRWPLHQCARNGTARRLCQLRFALRLQCIRGGVGCFVAH